MTSTRELGRQAGWRELSAGHAQHQRFSQGKGVAEDRPKEHLRVRGVGTFYDGIRSIAYMMCKSNTNEAKTRVLTTRVLKENTSDSLKPTVPLRPSSFLSKIIAKSSLVVAVLASLDSLLRVLLLFSRSVVSNFLGPHGLQPTRLPVLHYHMCSCCCC